MLNNIILTGIFSALKQSFLAAIYFGKVLYQIIYFIEIHSSVTNFREQKCLTCE